MQTETILRTPVGLDEIVATFGDIRDYIRRDGTIDPEWEENFLAHAEIPFPILSPGTRCEAFASFAVTNGWPRCLVKCLARS